MSQVPFVKQRANTAFDNMEFPPYDFREFPMAVPVLNGVVMAKAYDERGQRYEQVIVNSREELDELRGPEVVLVPLNPAAPDAGMRVQGEEDIRALLYVQAEQAKCVIDKRWSVAKIEAALQEHAAKSDVV